jgi:hypothetical protein
MLILVVVVAIVLLAVSPTRNLNHVFNTNSLCRSYRRLSRVCIYTAVVMMRTLLPYLMEFMTL